MPTKLARALALLLFIQSAGMATAQQCGRLFADDAAAGSGFGAHFVLDQGQQAAITATRDDGAAPGAGAIYVLEDNGTRWEQRHKIVAYDAVPNLSFGSSLGLEGDRLVVGARYADLGVVPTSGTVYVYGRDNLGDWIFEHEFSSSDLETGDRFGQSMALSGDELLVGAYQEDSGALNAGAVYAFSYDPLLLCWVETQKLMASDPGDTSLFGSALSRDGDRLMVAANRDSAAGIQAGAVYVFERDPQSGLWSETQKLLASDPTAGLRFGFSLDLDGDRALIGAIGDSANAGAAYVFERDPQSNTWSEVQKLSAAVPTPASWYGSGVDLDGERALIGATAHDMDAQDGGLAYVLDRDPLTGLFAQTLLLRPADTNAGALYGGHLLLEQGTAWIGAVGDAELGVFTGAVHQVDVSQDADGDGLPDACNPLGIVYCDPSVPNSTGSAALCRAIGSKVAGNNSLGLMASGLPPHQFGYFLASEQMLVTPMAGGSQGTLCLGGPAGRFLDSAQSSGPAGSFSFQPDLTALPAPLTSITAGETWHFTAWYRDVNPTPTSNFTDAVQIAFN
jgi:hypothetical protein